MGYIICIVFILILGSMAYFFIKTNALHTEKQVMLQEHQKEKTIAFIILNNKNDIEHDLKQENQNLEVAYKNILILEKKNTKLKWQKYKKA